MKTSKLIYLLVILLFASTSMAQKNVTISGFIKCVETGKGLYSSSVYAEELKIGTITNVYGFYSITLPKGNYSIQYSHIGYHKETIQIELLKNINRNIKLQTTPTISRRIIRKRMKQHKQEGGKTKTT